MYAAYAKQSILCYCSLPAASPGKLGYCAIKHEGLLDLNSGFLHKVMDLHRAVSVFANCGRTDNNVRGSELPMD